MSTAGARRPAASALTTLCLAALVAFLALGPTTPSAGAAHCDPPVANEIVCENSKPGSPASEWDVDGAGDPAIQGFATDISVNQGETVRFKVDTFTSNYRLDIYRLGYYGGNGARKVATVEPSVTLPQIQPECLNDASTGLIDCGNWAQSASWAVPADAVSGIYIARPVREDGTEGASHIVFVVRDDDGRSDLLFQPSDTTWQAYNSYGGNSLYQGSPAGRAYKVSYNRPFATRGQYNVNFLFSAEYPMIRWLEANGYDVSYFTGVDSDRRGAEILEHDLFLSVGHDEYWSGGQRANVEAARAAGVHLGFFSGNEVFWKTRWEASIDGSNTAHRTLVTYKETHAGAKIDPQPNVWTGTWRDPRFSPPADGGRPENALTGTIFTVNGFVNDAMTVPAEYGQMRLWRNTSIAALGPGETATFPLGTLGYEWDEDLDNGFRPAGLVHYSSTTLDVPGRLTDHGSSYAPGRATHHLTLYRHSAGALVFGAGTVQWSWGLDKAHDHWPGGSPPDADLRMQQATVNLFADMGVQPQSREPGLVAATASTDTTAPTSTVTSPAHGSTVQTGNAVTISGTASDAGGGVVSNVEVSVDGGATWRRATGRNNWSYTWTPGPVGSATIRSRAVDDSANLGTASPGVTVTIGPRDCPCSLWNDSITPGTEAYPDALAVELGLKFKADVDGFISGVRFYKGPGNTGTHVGRLWTSSGTKLAEATFTNETASGWQTVSFPSPFPVSANTTYVASYHAPNGHYAVDRPYFTSEYASQPLRALADGASGPNGVFKYGAGGFPTDTSTSPNYWVDVVFTTDGATDTSSPVISGVDARDVGASGATIVWQTDEPADSRVDYGTSPGQLTSSETVAGFETAHSVRLTGLGTGTTYYYRVTSADPSGNSASSEVQQFTASASACPCSLWDDSVTPGTESFPDSLSVELGVKFKSDLDGFVSGIRFYKGPLNTGTHVGRLWTASGTKVAEATFTSETATGWQQVSFASPVPISANTTYVASYHAPNGHYAVDRPYFTSEYTSAPLRALADGASGPNGVFKYGAGGFPTDTSTSPNHAPNYWVDVVFTTEPPSSNNTWTETTVADFSDGALSDTQVTNAGGGEVTLASSSSATFADSFTQADGPAVNWEPWPASDAPAFQPTWNVTNGVYVHDLSSSPDGSNYHPSMLIPSKTPSGDFTFSARQRIVQEGAGPGDVGVIGFVVGAPDQQSYYIVQYARPVAGTKLGLRIKKRPGYPTLAENLTLPDPEIGRFYDLRVEIVGKSFNVSVDGVLQLTHTEPGYVAGRVGLLGYEGSRNEFDDVQITGSRLYTSSGTYTSNVFDAGAPADWGGLTASTDTPAGTSIVLKVRRGNTVTPDSSWTPFATVVSGGTVGGNSRYIQYQAQLATSDSGQSPVLKDVTINYRAATGNQAPVAVDDAYSLAEDELLTVEAAAGVLANDSDGGGDALSAELASGPASGNLTLNPDGSFSYAPASDFNGSDSFSYQASDGNAASAPATVTLTVGAVNDAPVAFDDEATTDEDSAVVIDVLANDSDVDGDTPRVASVGQPSNGTAQANLDSSVTYTPNTDFSGADGFTYSISDGKGGTDTASVAVTVEEVTGIAFRAASSARNHGAGTLVIPGPAGLERGDLMLATVNARSAPTIVPPDGWRLLRRSQNSSMVQATFYRFLGRATPASYAWTLTPAQAASGAIVAYSGADREHPIDAVNGQSNGSSSSITAPSVTTTVPDTWLVGFFGIAAQATIQPPSGMVERVEEVNDPVAVTTEIADGLQAAPGPTGTRVATASTAARNAGHLIALRPTGSSDPVPSAPGGLTARVSSVAVTLDWNDGTAADLDGYDVYRSASATGSYERLNGEPMSSSQYEDRSAPTGATSYYKVVTVDAAGNESDPVAAEAMRRIAFRAAASAHNATSSTLVLTVPVGTVAGDLMLASVAARGAPAVTPPDGWTLIRSDVRGTTLRQVIYYRIAGASEPFSYAWTFSASSSAAGGILAYSGVDSEIPVDVAGGQTNSSSRSITAPSVTTRVADALLIGVFGLATRGTIAPPDGMLEQVEEPTDTHDHGIATEMADAVQAAVGPTGRRIARSSREGSNIGQLVAIRPAGAPLPPGG